jgi:hypothetical protein
MNLSEIKKGDRVHYTPRFGDTQNGIVKGVTERGVWVVFHCDGNWDDYEHYTGSLTSSLYLNPGWIEQPKTEEL